MTRLSRAAELGLDAVTIEGGLIAPEQVQKITAAPATPKLASSYDCPRGTNLNDEIARYFRIGQAVWSDYERIEHKTVTHTARFVHNLLSQCFGFDDLAGPVEYTDANRRYRLAWEAKQGRVPVVVAAPAAGRETFNLAALEFGDGAGGGRLKRSPVSLLQDWLNSADQALWGFVFAGDRVRLMRDNASLTRPAWIEADLGAIFREEMFADFTAWWLLIHATRFGAAGASPSDCALEDWRAEGLKQGETARADLYKNVCQALAELGQGAVEANPGLRETLADHAALTAFFEELLRTAYRLIFLAVAEDRDLLHPGRVSQESRALYRDSYSFGFWRERARRRVARDTHHDAWEAMKITLCSLEHGQELLGLPALGGLFSAGATPMMNGAKISNRRFLTALFHLGFITRGGATHRINWRDLKTEELGSVYEGLLEITPQLGTNDVFDLSDSARGNARKTSGSYYTPDSLVEMLLDSALAPVLRKAEDEADTPELKVAAILDLKVIDPACGSGHFLLGAARRMADRVAKLRNEDAGKEETQAALRDVVGRCIHGVDRNPMAVELAKVALWIESVSPGKPLGFLDGNIRCGDALLGVFDLEALEQGIPDEAYKPLTGDNKDAAKYYLLANRDAKSGQGAFDFAGGGGAMPPAKLAANLNVIRKMPEDTVGQVEKKREAYAAWRHDPARWATRVACDLYVTAFLLPKTKVPPSHGARLVPTTADVRKRLGGGQVYPQLETAAVEMAKAARLLHWPLAFPDVMIERGGFDVVIGNPPWERIKLQEQEFFAGTAVAEAANAAARTRLIRKWAEAEAGSYERSWIDRFETAKRLAEASGVFFTSPKDEDPTKLPLGVKPAPSRRYPWTGRGDVNTYALFAEHFLKLVRKGGRAGVIVPTGIATDATTAPFFGHLVDGQWLAALNDFENSAPLFPGVHRSFKFCLLTIGTGVTAADFAFFLTDPVQLEDGRRRFTLSPQEIARINPNTKTAPVFRSRRDAELTASIYNRVPVLIEEKRRGGNAWNLDYASKFFDMTYDAGSFVDRSSLNGSVPSTYVPLMEAKYIHFFDACWNASAEDGDDRASESEVIADSREPFTRYLIARDLVEAKLKERNWSRQFMIGVRKITNTTNERTIFSTFMPLSGAGNSLHVLFPNSIAVPTTCGLIGSLNSIIVDMIARNKLGGTNLNWFYVAQLPILPPSAYSDADLAFIVPRVLELTYTSHSMAPFARDLGYAGAPFAWDEGRRAQLRAELDAWYALAYGLIRDELRYVLDPADIMGPDYPSETFRVLKSNEERKFDEYRTRRLVLAAYDDLIAQGMRPRLKGYR
ncbi:Eco57I restriction-modification methylase domain-containing protein [Caballeronia concitans]|uniref:site-specific DNA-methyltransferase (adenine-specific) n=1 Tax=Caballeronia concitans TaxID=1777133 RepID=A0A658R4I6_9BURK|nr:N-6 DNA methylase [Caballeronia concitans]SAL49304.1 putative type I restriction enzymeP M protein [Caballeronia concitans]